jgi:hypothetical protein
MILTGKTTLQISGNSLPKFLSFDDDIRPFYEKHKFLLI